MLVDTWNAMLDSFRKTFPTPTDYRKRNGLRSRRRVSPIQLRTVESLEDRTLLSISGALPGGGNDVVFQGVGGPINAIVFSVDGVGNLQHDLGGQFGFNSNIDLDSNVPGDQIRPVNALTSLAYFDQDATPNDSVTFASSPFNLVNGTFTQLSVNAGTINLANNATILVAGNGAVNLTASQNIGLASAANITTQNGGITLSANQQLVPIAATFVGILVNGGMVSSNTGTVILRGRGGNSGTGNLGVQLDASGLVRGGNVQITGEGGGGADNVYGVLVDNGATVTANGGGTVTVKGDGGGINQHNIGVYVRNATIISGGGNVQVIGGGSLQGVDDNYGVSVEFAGLISAGALGNVSVEGTGHGTGGLGYGVRVGFGGTITSGGGNVQVTGVGSTTGTNSNFGVALDQTGSQITAGGSGSVNVNGTGNGTGASNVGVWLETGSKITSSGGDVLVIGTGGDSSGANNHGVNIDASGGEISAGGSGNVTVNGMGGNATGDSNRGVSIDGPNSIITQAGGGDVTVNGNGNGTGGVSFSYGVMAANGGQIRATGAGQVTVQGAGGGGTGDENFGVFLDSGGIITDDGDIVVIGIEGGGASGLGINLLNTDANVQTTGIGNIDLIADSLNLGTSANVDAGTHRVTLRPFAAGTAIVLGFASDPIDGPLCLSDDELDRIFCGTLQIGDPNSDTINVTSDVTRGASTAVELKSNKNIVIGGGQIDAGGGTLLLQPSGPDGSELQPTLAGIDATATTVTLDGLLGSNIDGLAVDTQYTQLNVTGEIVLTNAGLELTGGYTFVAGDTVTIVSATSITDTFSGLPDNGTLNFNGQTLRINYTSTTVTLTLALGNIPPVINSGSTANVNENASSTTVVLDVDATDADLPAQTLTYSLTGTDAPQFSIDPATGEIRFVNSPDFETPTDVDTDNVYDITVTVDDGNGGSATQSITITVLPLNDNSPSITAATSAAVNENTAASVVVLDVNATDADLPVQALTYSLTGTDAPQFSIDPATGEIRFVNSPDFETPTDADTDNVYDITVTVDDGNGGSATQSITITVLPLNDNFPSITAATSAAVNENTATSVVVLDVDATDADLPAQTLTYSLTGTDAPQFSIDPATGEIRFVNSPDFEVPTDADTNNVYDITVTVDDGNGGSATQGIAITVLPLNDNSPVITSGATALVDENTSAASVVLDVNATDADLPAQTLTFSLSGADAAEFSIDPTTGEVRFRNSPDFEAPTDADMDNTYDVTVTAADGSGGTTSQILSITVQPVNDNTPLITSGSTSQVVSNTPAATVILDVEAADADLPAQGLVFSLAGPDAGQFSIDPAKGEIRFLSSPDFLVPTDVGADNIYDVIVAVTDNGVPANSVTQSLTITVTTSNSPPLASDGVLVANEDTATGSLLVGNDPDLGDILTFSVVAVPAHGSVTITDPQTGDYLYTPASDYNGPDSFTFQINDGLVDSNVALINVTVNPVNDPPAANDAVFSVRENSAVGTVIGTVTATDPDSSDTQSFAITSGNTGNTFAINPATGEITIANNAILNFDVQPTFNLQVTVGDGSNATDTADVTINVREALVVTFQSPIQTYVPSGGPVCLDPQAIARDAEVPNINYNGGTLTVTNMSPQAGDRVGVLTQGNGPSKISVLFGNIVYESSLVIIGQIVSDTNGGPLEIRFTSYAREAAVDALLRAICFSTTSSMAQQSMRTVEFNLVDGSGNERDIKSKSINVMPVAAVPTFALPGGDLFYVNSTPPQALDANAVVSETPNLMGGRLTVIGTQGIRRQDRLSLLAMNGISVASGEVRFNGQVIGRLKLKRSSLTVDLTTVEATPLAVQALLRSIAFSTTKGNSANRVLAVTLSDGHGNSSTVNKTVHVS